MTTSVVADIPVDEATRRRHAARLGVLLFLGSEALLFAGLFALYAAYRAQHPDAFMAGVREDLRWLGSLNTAILLISSGSVAIALARLHADRARSARRWLLLTILLGLAFLGLKGWEYSVHIHDGILPGGRGSWFLAHRDPGLPVFFSLYYLMTGLHGAHVLLGIGWLALMVRAAGQGRRAYDRVELGGMYWHFIDLVWLYLWPLFYLLGGGR